MSPLGVSWYKTFANDTTETRFGLGLPWALRSEEYTREYLIANYAAWPVSLIYTSIRFALFLIVYTQAYLLGLAGFKLALCISYLRMTRGSLDTRYRHFIIAVAVFSSIAHLVFLFLFMFACMPVSRIIIIKQTTNHGYDGWLTNTLLSYPEYSTSPSQDHVCLSQPSTIPSALWWS